VSGYVTGGAIPLDSDAYISRPFEEEAFRELAAGNWIVLLAPRQQGKTSALIRLRARLEEEGLRCALVDLQGYGGNGTYVTFLSWLCEQIGRELGQSPEPPTRGEEDLEVWLDATLREIPNLVIILDEASAVPPAHQRRFFSQLRALYNRRARDLIDAVSRRLQVAFAGTFRPEELIDTPNSPFNVSQEIIAEDLSRDDAEELAARLTGEDALEYANRAYELVGGQPFLLQTLLAAADRGANDAERASRFEYAVESLRHGRNSHVAFLFQLVRRDEALAGILRRILESPEGIRYHSGDADHDFAQVSGLATVRGGRLQIRNELYKELATNVFLPAEPRGTSENHDPPPAGVDVLLVTATLIESRAVRDAFLGDVERPAPRMFGQTNSYVDLGVVNGLAAALVQTSSMGSGGAGGATLTVSDAIRELGPRAVYLVGIAFGVDPERQRIGDVFISERVLGYELQRIGTDEEGEEEIRMRGERITASPRLLSLLRSAALEWSHRTQFGLLLSGEKLVDRVDFRNELRHREPDAIGGEMEATGVSAAAARQRTEWIVVKGCCDFADGRKRENEDQNQALAANQAVGFVHFALTLHGRSI